LRLALGALVAVLAVGAVGAVVTSASSHHRSNAEAQPTATFSPAAASSPAPSVAPAPASASTLSTQESSPLLPSALSEVPMSASPIASATADPQAALKQQVISAYLAFEQTLYQQLAVIAPDMTPLLGVATGQVLASSEDAVGELRGKGEVERGAPVFSNVVVGSLASPTVAIVCASQDDGPTKIVEAKSGSVVASGFQRFTTRTTMVLTNGVWKASVASSGGSCP
jgi:hypothetical protein